MPRKLDDKIAAVLKEHGFGPDACWDCHGVWVVYHRVLEQIAAQAGIAYDEPKVLVAEREAAAILVTGRLADKTEWSIGEAAIGMNYKVSGKQAGYPFAMAEKRAKDRVILKLIGLHGLAYSEEEADDFKKSPEPRNVSVKDADWVTGPAKNREELRTKLERLRHDILGCDDLDELKGWVHGPDADFAPLINQIKGNWPAAWDSTDDPVGLKQTIESRRDELKAREADNISFAA